LAKFHLLVFPHAAKMDDTIDKSLIEDRGYYALLSIPGLLKLSLKVSFCCLCKQLQIIQYYIYNRLYYTRVGVSCPESIYRSLADNIVY
jgi:hypothetical protein